MARVMVLLTVLTTLVALLGGFRYLANEWRLMKLHKRQTGKWLVVLAVCLLPSWVHAAQEAICDNAAIVACDNWESRSTSQPSQALSGNEGKNPTWTRSQVGTSTSGLTIIDVATTPEGVHNGSRALQLAYPAGNDGTDYMDGTLPSAYQDFYWRWYVKYSSNFQWSGVATKHNELLLSGGEVGDTPQLAWTGDINSCGTNPTSPMKPTIFMYNSSIHQLAYCGFPRNVSDVPTIGFNTWYCVEAHVKANTNSSTDDGELDLWLDGVQILHYTGFKTFENGTSRIDGLFVSGYWNNSQSHGLMYRWEDDHVAGTERIGCLDGGGGPIAGVMSSGSLVFFYEAIPVTMGLLWHFRQAVLSGILAVWMMGGAFLSLTTQKTKQISYTAAVTTVQGVNKVLGKVARKGGRHDA